MILNAYGIQIKGKPSTWYAECRRPPIYSAHYAHVPGSVYTKYHFYYIADNEWKKGIADCRFSSQFFHSPPKWRRNMMLMVARSEFLLYLLFYLNRAYLSLMASHKTESSKAWSDFQRLIDVKIVMRNLYVTRANNEFSRVPKSTPALPNLDMKLLQLPHTMLAFEFISIMVEFMNNQ